MSDLEKEIRDTMEWLSGEPLDINQKVLARSIFNLIDIARNATDEEYDAASRQLIDLIWE